MNRLGMLTLFGALLAGFATAYVDFHATEETATLLVVVIGTFAAGFAYGRLGWLWALIVAASLTSAHLLGPYLGIVPRDGGHIGNPLSLMIVAVPAAVSSYLGAGLRELTKLKHS